MRVMGGYPRGIDSQVSCAIKVYKENKKAASSHKIGRPILGIYKSLTDT